MGRNVFALAVVALLLLEGLALPIAPARASTVDLSGYHGILSFRLEKKYPDSHFWLTLR